jgi:hypothetical protein
VPEKNTGDKLPELKEIKDNAAVTEGALLTTSA